MTRNAARVEGLGTTVFAEMSALALATGSINLGQGFPDTDGPREVAEAAVRAIREGHNQYPPGAGIPALRSAVSAHRAHFTGLAYDPDGEVLVTTGATEAIAAALLGLVDPGDEVVVLEPYYDSYVACIGFAGGVRRPVTLRPPTYALDADALRRAVTPQNEGPVAELSAQPHGCRAVGRRADGRRRGRRRARPGGRRRRGLRAHGLRRRAPARASGVPARDARTDAVDRVGRQDVLVHRVEGGLGHRPLPSRRVRAARQAVPHLRVRRTVPTRHRPGTGPPGLLLLRPP